MQRQEIETFDSGGKLKKRGAPKPAAEKEAESSVVLGSIGALATKIAQERKERGIKEMKVLGRPRRLLLSTFRAETQHEAPGGTEAGPDAQRPQDARRQRLAVGNVNVVVLAKPFLSQWQPRRGPPALVNEPQNTFFLCSRLTTR